MALPCACWRDLKTRSLIIPVVVRKGLMSGFPLTCGRLTPIQPIYILRICSQAEDEPTKLSKLLHWPHAMQWHMLHIYKYLSQKSIVSYHAWLAWACTTSTQHSIAPTTCMTASMRACVLPCVRACVHSRSILNFTLHAL